MTFHGGNIYAFAQKLDCDASEIIDFSSNIHFRQAVNWRELQLNLQPYADSSYTDLKRAIKARYALPEKIAMDVFNGASAAIFALLRWLKPEKVVLYTPMFSDYQRVINSLNCEVFFINRLNENIFAPIPKNSTVIFVNPSTPDGKCYDLAALFSHWKTANCNVIIDDSFLDFCDAPSMLNFIDDYNKLFIVKSLCKFYGCAGVRVGFIAAQSLKDFDDYEASWRVSTFDNFYMQAALKNTAFIEQTRLETKYLREKLKQVLVDSNLFEKIYDGSVNFVLARLANNIDLQTTLANSKMLIRECASFDGLTNQDIRFAVKSAEDIEKLAKALRF